ncbi:MAG: hypothetical protein C0616_06990 [Desulfuromonas sp.]|nr:MAG: hypothetical protein C0616_06990 [Desulfuromonas sp.]
MGFWLFLLLLVVIGCGVYFCHRLKLIEEDIRRDLAADENNEEAPPQEETPVDSGPAEPVEMEHREEASGPAEQILTLVQREPGIKQTELYGRIPDQPRKSLQEQLRKLADDGRLRRVKKGSSYQLFPA